MSALEKLRHWLLLKLGGVDRALCVEFVREYVQPSDNFNMLRSNYYSVDCTKGALVVWTEHAYIAHLRLGFSSGRIVMAPWCRQLRIHQVHYETPLDEQYMVWRGSLDNVNFHGNENDSAT